MASVDDIRLKEGYLEWSTEASEPDMLIVKPEKRDWKRTNYQMDLRYIELFIAQRPNKKITVYANLRHMGFWHIDLSFLSVLVDGLTNRIKNKVSKIIIMQSTVPVWLVHWWMHKQIPDRVKSKIQWK